ncbi:hypothetical protein [Coraliomargarita akajimensis]|uniref:PEP-CTERM protein-sorting domain-containing protein n=1 Tax=Coraliomargarita akajimensis (strain DSM 45221 / IAM 15411 / JCM 23193 / KCTC 12865 / 04OKA010-24) TaxID=583355 RepID=D5EJH8_CORAD|nr:hypothetical protein [Coraliomargarita akajimensis]ADE54577.1 hypothetical protein Caka_1558 [Coraliomargarita akajimensis DSM 45221]
MTAPLPRKLLLLVLASSISITLLQAEPIDSTLIVNFYNPAGDQSERLTPAFASDYQALAPDVQPSAPVNVANHGTNQKLLKAIGIDGVTVSLSPGSNTWNTDVGLFADTPILDSYMYVKGEKGALSQTLTLEGLNDIPEGQIVTVTIWGTGDTDGSDTAFALNYNGKQSETKVTDYNGGTAQSASVSFTFKKVANSNEVTILWGPNGPETSGIGGFAMTTTTKGYTGIPELQHFPLIAGLIAVGYAVSRRRRSVSVTL